MPAFRSAYRSAVADVLPFLSSDGLEQIGRHNPGWKPPAFNPRAYLEASETRYSTALATFARCGGRGTGPRLRVLDAGGFMGAFPLALRRLGASVTLSEKYGYYYGAFDRLRDFLIGEGVEVWDLDLTDDLDSIPAGGFDLVTAMAVLEHLAHSPKPIMGNLTAFLAPDGKVVVEVPNIAYWPKRLAFLRGASPLPPLVDLYEAEQPFTGHHREYTRAELRDLLAWSGLAVDEIVSFNYTPWGGERLLDRLLEDIPRKVVPSFREVLLACASRSAPGCGEAVATR